VSFPVGLKFRSALPFYSALILWATLWSALWLEGWHFVIAFSSMWCLIVWLDLIGGVNSTNLDTETDDAALFWHRALTLGWVPLQMVTLFSFLYLFGTGQYDLGHQIAVFVCLGMVNGVIGINYAHELMHQRNKWERGCADVLLAMVMYSHFRSEHLLVHHTYVGTPRDPVSARYGEGFYSYFVRVVPQCYRSAFQAETAKLARKSLPMLHYKNPFLLYWAMQFGLLIAAYLIAGWSGIGLFLLQSIVAIYHLEVVNYVEHYGLTRKHLGNGKYEPVRPRHSWNAAHRVSNWVFINLQRHSDHHYKPARRFPLLQNYADTQAPQLPYGYPIMTVLALFPRAWRARMNPRVRKWRAMYYPEITDWTNYNNATTPMPR